MSFQRLFSSSPMAAGFLAALASWGPAVSGEARPGGDVSQLDPKGKIHIPIGIPDTLDSPRTFEEGPRMVLLAGVPPSWLIATEQFSARKEIKVTGLPTHHGSLSLVWRSIEGGAQLLLTGGASLPGGGLLRWPPGLKGSITVGGQPAERTEEGDISIPAGGKEVRIVE